MDEIDITGGESGIDRRDFIRKSALVGGMVWAAPMVSSLGRPAFAITGEITPPGQPSPDPEGSISYVAFIVRNAGSGARFKYDWEPDDGCEVGAGAGQVESQCETAEYLGIFGFANFGVAYASTAEGTTDPNEVGFTIVTTCPETDEESWTFEVVPVDPEVPYVFDAAAVKAGQNCEAVEGVSGATSFTAQPISNM